MNPIKNLENGKNVIPVFMKNRFDEYCKTMEVIKSYNYNGTILFKAIYNDCIYYCSFNSQLDICNSFGLIFDDKIHIENNKVSLCRIFASICNNKLFIRKYSRGKEFLKFIKL